MVDISSFGIFLGAFWIDERESGRDNLGCCGDILDTVAPAR